MIVNPGIRRFLGSAIQRLFNSASFYAPLTHSLVLERGTGSPSFTRATTATWKNNDGYLVTGVAGEIGFVGARRIRNLVVTSSENLGDASWVKSSVTAVNGVITAAAANAAHYLRQISATAVVGNTYIMQAVLSKGTHKYASLGDDGDAAYHTATFDLDLGVVGATSGATSTMIPTSVTGEYLCTVKFTRTNSGTVRPGVALVANASAVDFAVFNAAGTETIVAEEIQLENVTAQTTQTAGEYVSVGVESAPYYHGSMVDGVKCFPTDLAGNALPTSYTYDAVSLNGVAGTYVSTPDSVANSDTGSKDLRFKLFNSNWATGGVITNRNSNNVQFDTFGGGGLLRFAVNHSSVTAFATSDVSPTTVFANNTVGWLRVTYDITSGEVLFYTSSDGVAWDQLGTAQSLPTGAIDEPAGVMSLGSDNVGTNPMPTCRIYSAQIYNGIDGTLAVDFDASRYAGGTTLTGSTGETWTLQGNAVIHPTNNPMRGYIAEGARTNLCLQSNAFTTAPWGNDLDVISQNAIGPDGATSAWTATDSSAVAARFFQAGAMTLTAAPWTTSIFVKKTSGATSFPVSYMVTGSSVAVITIDTNNGVATPWTAYTGATIVPCTAVVTNFNADYWRVAFTFTATAVAWAFTVYVAATTNATQSTGALDVTAQGSAVFYGAQVELGSFASSYIATTTAAVTRNKDEESVSTSGNIAAAAGSIYLEYTPTHAPSGTVAFWGTYVDADNYTAILHDATNLIFRKRIAGSNYDATIANAFVSGTTYKVAATWGAAGTAIYLDGVAGTPHANTTAAQIAATMQVGADGNSLQQPGAGTTNLRIWQRQLSIYEGVAVTA